MYIIIKGSNKYGKTRSEIEDNLRKDGLSSLTDEQLSKCKYLEKKAKESIGSKGFMNQGIIDNCADKITE